MENILVRGKKNISKVFILALIFIGLISAFSMVNAADEKKGDFKVEYSDGKDILNTTSGTITIREGEEIVIRLPETEWGYVKAFDIVESDEEVDGTDIIDWSSEGESKGSFSKKLRIIIKAKEVSKKSTCSVEIKYIPKGISSTQTAKYKIVVDKNVTSFEITKNPQKVCYTIGEEVNLAGMKMKVKYLYSEKEDEFISNEKGEKLGLTYSPKKIAADTKTITVTYKGKSDTFNITVKENKPVTPQQPTQSEGSNQKPSNSSNNQPETKVYTNKLTVGDKLKLKSGSGWKKYKSKSINSAYKTMTGGTTFTIEAIDGNWLTIKGESTYKYLYYGPEASSYFSRVTTTSNSSNSSNSSSTANTTNTTAPQYSNGTAVKKGDSIKMTKGNSWNVYSDSSCKTIKTYIQASKGLTYKVESISGNILKISQAGKEVGYIKWYNSNTGARSYFSNVGTSASVETGTKVETQQGTSTEVISQTMNLLVNLIETIFKSILEGITTAK